MKMLRSTPEFKPSEVVVAEEVIDSYLRDPHGSGYHALVAELDSAIAGYICYGPAPLTEGTWDIYWMSVAPEKQGRGTGGALLSYAEDKIRQARGRLIVIETSSQAGYEKTRRFYLNHGYETIGRLPDFYAPGDDKLILQKQLR
jgi:GNAT superfamily N-acetyltransferase